MDSITSINKSTTLWHTSGYEPKETFLLESKYAAAEEERSRTINDFFLVAISLVIYSMQFGFGLLEAGSVHCKKTGNILLKNLVTSFVSAIAFWLIGYGIAYGDGTSFIGYTAFAHSGMTGDQLSYWFFQYVLAATTVAIVSGAITERCTVWMYPIYTLIITGLTYPIVVHWAWSTHGWLAAGRVYDLGYDTPVHIHFEDAGGGSVVHIVGGLTGFIATAIIGPRHGCFDEETVLPNNINGHSTTLTIAGGLVLFVGFIALNSGSQGALMPAAVSVASLGKSVSNTVLGAAGAGLAAFILNRLQKFRNRSIDKRWDVLTPLNSCLAGMVSVCACSHEIASWASFSVGILGGVLYSAIKCGVLRMRIDDPLQAAAVHAGGGVTGVISLAFFKEKSGIVYAWNRQSALFLGWQLAGVAAVIGWACLTSSVLFLGLKLTRYLRGFSRNECKGWSFPFFRKTVSRPKPKPRKRSRPTGSGSADGTRAPSRLLAPMRALASIKKRILKKSDKRTEKKSSKKAKKKSDLEAAERTISVKSSAEMQDDMDVILELDMGAEVELEVEADVESEVEADVESEVEAEVESEVKVEIEVEAEADSDGDMEIIELLSRNDS